MENRKTMHQKNEKAITLIALVITIIVLLILAGISIATLTGENGVLTKASTAEKNTDIAETKEQIKLELMGNFDEQGNSYTNQDVINAVKKITEKEVAENTEIVQSKKGNDIDISDLWVEHKDGTGVEIHFTLDGVELTGYSGDTWITWLRRNQNSDVIPADIYDATAGFALLCLIKRNANEYGWWDNYESEEYIDTSLQERGGGAIFRMQSSEGDDMCYGTVLQDGGVYEGYDQ